MFTSPMLVVFLVGVLTAPVMPQTIDAKVQDILSVVRDIHANLGELTKRIGRVENRQMTTELLSSRQMTEVQSRLSSIEARQQAHQADTNSSFQQMRVADNQTKRENSFNFRQLAAAVAAIKGSVDVCSSQKTTADMSGKLSYLSAAANLTHLHLASVQQCCTTSSKTQTQQLGQVLAALDKAKKELESQKKHTSVKPSPAPTSLRPSYAPTQASSTKYYASTPEDCKEVFDRGQKQSGYYNVKVQGLSAVHVWCDSGAITIQRRHVGDVNFDRSWADYERGFGQVRSDHWLGLRMIHAISAQHKYSLITEFYLDDAANRAAKIYDKNPKDGDGTLKYVAAREFSVSGADTYRLQLVGVTSNLRDPYGVSKIEAYHGGMAFSARDKDQDGEAFQNCAREKGAGWWHNGCYYFNPNTNQGNDRPGSCSKNNRVCARMYPYAISRVEMKLTRC